MTMDEKDRRRPLLYQLRRQLQEDEITFEDARRAVVELESALEKVTAPANRVGTLLSPPDHGVAYIQVGGSEYYANIDARLDEDLLKVGTRVLVNDAFAVVGDMGASPSGTVGKILDALEDGRLQVGNEQGTQSHILIRGTDLEDVTLKTGEEVRIDPGYRVALEKMPHSETKDYYLEEVPELPWDKVGGHDDAIQAIKDTIEMPVLHPELFERFQYSTPKGFLLYGPPGCGKTLIGKATAYNLEKQVKADGTALKACFMHIKGPEILNMWLGESERKVREVFAQAREKRREGYLPVVFIDEAESVLGTRRASRSHNISNTIVPMFCAEMDGIESLQDIVIILTSNRPDMIDPAILRPGRIDRKIKIGRPDEASAKEILGIYLTKELPIDTKEIAEHGGNIEETVQDIVTRTIEEVFAKRDDTRFLEVTLRSGRKDILTRGDLCSGAVLESIVRRAKEYAIKRSIASGMEEGIGFDDMFLAVETEFAENEIFPPSDNSEDWLKLLDYDPENVVRVAPIRPERTRRVSRTGVV
jgi:proteasome-associated ATPase